MNQHFWRTKYNNFTLFYDKGLLMYVVYCNTKFRLMGICKNTKTAELQTAGTFVILVEHIKRKLMLTYR